MFVVERRDRNTLLPLLVEHIDLKTTIHSDGWRAYSGLNTVFHDHKVVNHSENFVDPKTRCHTQLIECIWGHAKLKIIKNKRGTTSSLLHCHLSFFCFCYLYKDEAFEKFLEIIGKNN
ncbi:hypothetical protein HERIO_875 [Hepatospora eriocheir]|uniref:ISXO2-like transposase domain-containing protein n=1 Tax=Hepatospora eriocheir TaxID=1081669 RepID=A0A1X0QBY9_9MICR|nr:hypothetical protein HERIO_875 [Hepatospora eriocheir]